MTQRTCSIPDCESPVRARGWCSRHYRRWWRAARSVTDPSRAERFWAKVNRDGPVPDYAPHLGPCWLWTAAKTKSGSAFYGMYLTSSAHRYAYELMVGPIPDGLTIDHLCRVTLCVRPSHLEPVTNRVNILRGTSFSAIRAAQTQCIYGHELVGDNLIVDYRGCRQCRECHRRVNREAMRRRRANQRANVS